MEADRVTKKPKNVLKGSGNGTVEIKPNGMVEIKSDKSDAKPFILPKHIYDIATIVNNNYDIRRFTALNIIKALKETGDIEPFAKDTYVDFRWNKFTVNADGIRKQYTYREDFALTALTAAFEQFAKQSENVISVFIEKEDEIYNQKIAKLQAKHGNIADKVKPVETKSEN